MESGCAQAPPRLTEPRRSSFIVGLIVGVATATGLAVLFLFNPSQHSFYPFCVFYRTTGLLCPGCGGLRAVHQLLHGHLEEALHYNILAVLSLPVFAWVGLRQLLARVRHQLAPVLVRPLWLWLGLAVMVLFGILRNLPFAHAAWLAP